MSRNAGRLIGRDAVLGLLGEYAAQARAGTPTAVLLEGDAGIGKTRLVQEAVSSFCAPGDVVAVGHGVALAGGELP